MSDFPDLSYPWSSVPTVHEDTKLFNAPTMAALSATYAPLVDATFSQSLGLPGGGASRRAPINGAPTMDGSIIKTLPGDKVAFAFSSMWRGGFTGDSGGNPTFGWHANDFMVTGTTAGDLAGLHHLTARETEIHLYTPGATLPTAMKAMQLNCKIEAEAVGATVQSMFGLYVSSLSNEAGATVTNAYGIYIEAPTASAVNSYSLYVNGPTKLVGTLDVQGATTVQGNLYQHTGEARFAGAQPNSQGSTAGAYIGNLSGNYGIHFSNGTQTWAIDNDAGSLRFMQAGVAQSLALSFTGNLTIKDGGGLVATTSNGMKIATGATQKLGFWNATPAVQPTAVANATDAATVITQLNALLSRLRTIGLIAT